MTKEETKVVECIGSTGRAALKIAQLTALPIDKVNKILSRLTKKNIVTKKSDGFKYWLNKN